MLKTQDYDYKYGDLKFYYNIHVNRMRATNQVPVKYDQFIKRAKVMNLHDAIYTPRSKEVEAWKSRTPIEDNIRRSAKLKEQNVQILDLDELVKLETKPGKTNTIKIPQPKQTLLHRFLKLFR